MRTVDEFLYHAARLGVGPWSLVPFSLVYVMLVNAWMYQVVFTVRFDTA